MPQNNFRIRHNRNNVDFTRAFAADLTPHTHIYRKISVSYAELWQKFILNQSDAVTLLIPILQQKIRKSL